VSPPGIPPPSERGCAQFDLSSRSALQTDEIIVPSMATLEDRTSDDL